MMNFFYTYQSLFDHILVYAMLAMSQYVVLRAGVFSLGSAGFAAIGAYGCALLVVKAVVLVKRPEGQGNGAAAPCRQKDP